VPRFTKHTVGDFFFTSGEIVFVSLRSNSSRVSSFAFRSGLLLDIGRGALDNFEWGNRLRCRNEHTLGGVYNLAAIPAFPPEALSRKDLPCPIGRALPP
jgi:hypothetical protein